MTLCERSRRELGLTQEAMAKAAGVARRVVQKIEAHQSVRPCSYDKVAAFIGVKPRDLLLDYAKNKPEAS